MTFVPTASLLLSPPAGGVCWPRDREAEEDSGHGVEVALTHDLDPDRSAGSLWGAEWLSDSIPEVWLRVTHVNTVPLRKWDMTHHDLPGPRLSAPPAGFSPRSPPRPCVRVPL